MRAYLIGPDAEVVPGVHVRVDAERAHGSEDDLCGRVPVERRAWEVDGEVGVAQVLREVTMNLSVTTPVQSSGERSRRGRVTYMVHRPSSAMSPDERDAPLSRRAQVDLLPRVLVPPYHDTWVVAVQQQERLGWMLMSE